MVSDHIHVLYMFEMLVTQLVNCEHTYSQVKVVISMLLIIVEVVLSMYLNHICSYK